MSNVECGTQRRSAWLRSLFALTLMAWFATGESEYARGAELVVWGNEVIRSRGVPAQATNVVALSTVEHHTVALRADGTVVDWDNASLAPSLFPPEGLSGIVSISAGIGLTLTLNAEGRVDGWGYNMGELQLPLLRDVIAISVGWKHGLALRADGTVVSFGSNRNGQRDLPATVEDAVGVVAGFEYSLVVRSDGSVVKAGASIPEVPAEATNVVSLAAGMSHALALRKDGTVLEWGNKYESIQIPRPENLRDVIAVSASDHNDMALLADGTVVGWGANLFGQAASPPGLQNVKAIAAGPFHSIALIGNGPPRIFQHPRGFQSALGRNARLAVQADGKVPLSYQWRHGGLPIRGATNTVLALDGVSLFDNGDYDVVVSNSEGSATSRVAVVNVILSPPTEARAHIDAANGVVFLGGGITLSATAKGVPPFDYRWLFEGVPIPGADGRTLRIENATFADAGSYSVAVADPFGISTSAPVRVTVTQVAGWGSNLDHALDIPATATNVVALAAGYHQSVALREDGTVVVWGNRPGGEGTYPGGELRPPTSLTNAVAISAGGSFNVALLANGTVRAWGDTGFGAFSGVAGWTNIVAVSAGYAHTLGLRSDGKVLVTGANFAGQTNMPPGLDDAIAISAGWESSAVLRSDGTVVQWGGQPRIEGIAEANDIAAIGPGLALRNDGTLLGWNFDSGPHAGEIAGLAGSRDHKLLLMTDGTIRAGGDNLHGRAETPFYLSNVVEVAAGFMHNLVLIDLGLPRMIQQPLSMTALAGRNARLAVRAIGSLPIHYQWRQDGLELLNATNAVLALDGISPFDNGNFDVVVSNSYGSVTSRVATITSVVQPPSQVSITLQPSNHVAWIGGTAVWQASAEGSPPFAYRWLKEGKTISGMREAELTIPHLTLADAGEYSALVISPFGVSTSAPVRLSVVNVAAWGPRNGGSDARVFDVLPDTTNAVAISASQWHALALRSDSSVAAWGGEASGALAVPPSATNLSAIVAGGEFSLGLKKDGTVLTWGGPKAEAYGLHRLPAGLTNVVQLAAGYSWALALRADGTILGWGTAREGVMQPPALSNVIAISAGARHALALRSDGTVVGWGGNELHQAEPPVGLSNVVCIVAGNSYSMALCEDGTVVEWGRDTTSPPPEARDLVAIATGSFHRLGLREDGKVISWGFDNGDLGQTIVPDDLPPVVAIAAAGDASFGLVATTGEPRIARHPRRQNLFSGETLRLEAKLFPGSDENVCQWFKDGELLEFENRSFLEIPHAQPWNLGRYSVRISNAFGGETSREAEVKVTDQALLIALEPMDVLVTPGASVRFEISVSGSLPITYQWFFRGVRIPGATEAVLVLPSVTEENVGEYQAIIANSMGSVVSRSATLELIHPAMLTIPGTANLYGDLSPDAVTISYELPDAPIHPQALWETSIDLIGWRPVAPDDVQVTWDASRRLYRVETVFRVRSSTRFFRVKF